MQRADNAEALYFTELRKEVAAFPAAGFLNEEQIDALIRMTIAGVRAKLFVVRTPDGLGAELGKLNPRLWPFLLLCDSPLETARLLASLAGIFAGIPAPGKWFRP